eukprot:3411602-Rhodomonas_salina.1
MEEVGHEPGNTVVGVEGAQAVPPETPTKNPASPSGEGAGEHGDQHHEHEEASEQDVHISEEEREIALFAKEDLVRFGCEFAEIDEKLRFSQRWDERQQLLYELRDSAIKTDPRVLRTLRHVARNDDNVNLRLQAAEVLIHVGLQGIPEQIWLLSHEHWHTRLDALTTLERGAEADDEGVLAAFGTTLLDSSATVRERAIKVLITLAIKRKKELRAGEKVHRFPEFVVYRLLERLQDTDSKVRQTAIDGIVEVAVEGDSYIIQALAEKMQSDSAPIRKSGTEAMQRLALKFNEVRNPLRTALQLTCWCLSFPPPPSRRLCFHLCCTCSNARFMLTKHRRRCAARSRAKSCGNAIPKAPQ